MVQNSGAFSSLVDIDPVLSEIFWQKYSQLSPILLNRVIGVRSSNKSKETHQRIGSMGDPTPFNGQVDYGEFAADYEVEWSHGHLTKGFKVTQTMFEDNQYSGIFDQAGQLGTAFARKVVKDEASIFENAFNTGAAYLGYDAKPLVSASHPRSKSDSTNVSNLVSGSPALSAASLETAINQLEGLGDDLGNETGAMATVLLGGRNNRKKIRELTESQLTPESANNATNVDADLIGLIHPYISGNKWFVIDGPAAQMMLLWYNRIPVQFGADQDVSNTLMRSFFGRTRYSKGWQDYRFVVGSNAS